MTAKQKRLSKLTDVMEMKVIQLENGSISDKNLEELTEKIKCVLENY